ncbi:Small-subunit processome, Utp14 family-containing protein [Strongyloides ratti]|uniref:Small-subunit processome, Utp14 family-containing protein n=1 Tax=Strongyloides ratti TaxID=34506 RepID=A0A090LDW3_STRRB|nr:Small-subunit processome, Utp14 family-containing protein [Strongyloides ratti]CEF67952.1 Small-subunit processome, Utp14 family-containing protein [Strongyloides ratti]
MSDWESEEEFDEVKNKELLDNFFKNDDSKEKKKSFTLKKAVEEKVNIADMLTALKGKKGLDVVKKNFGIHTSTDFKKIQDKCTTNEENRGKGLKSKTLIAPMHKHAQDKIQAQVAYKDIKAELAEWNQVVSSNRVADQLNFPLNQEKLHNLGNTERLAGKIARTSLEKKMEQVVNGSKNTLDNDRPYTEAEEELLKAMDLKEAEEKIRKLQRERKLMSFRAAKNKYKAKIKSKTYHRIQKRSKRRRLVKEFEELVTKDPEAAREKLAEIEKDRLLERATLRHRTTGKWNKNLIKYAARNDGVRKILQEHIRFGKELKAKLLGIDEDELSDSEEEEEVDEEKEKKDYQTFMSMIAEEAAKEANKDDKKNETIVSALLDGEKNPWLKSGLLKLRQTMKAKEEEKRGFVTKVSDKKKKEIVKEMDLDEGWTIVGPKDEEYVVSKEDVNDDEDEEGEEDMENDNSEIDDDDEEEDEENNVKKISEKTIDEIFDEYFDSLIATTKLEEEAEEALDKVDDKNEGDVDEVINVQASSLKRKALPSDDNSNKKLKSTIDISLDPSKYLNLVTNHIEAIDDKINEHLVDDDRIHSLNQTNLIAEAFEDDDVISEFEKHKAKIEDDEKEKDIDLTLHGWGSWTGAGLKTKSKKEFIVKAPEKIRKDCKKHGVIIRQNVDSSIEKYQPDDVPFPYTSAKVYEAVIRQPIGMDWNPVSVNKELIAPNVRTRLGKIIRPISKDLVKKVVTKD